MKREPTDIRADLAQIRTGKKAEAPVHDILRQAAVVTHFDLFELSEQHADSDAAMMILMDDAVSLSSPDGAWGLSLVKRQSILASFPDRDAVRTCLASIENRPDNITQTTFELLMSSPDAVAGVLQGSDTTAIAEILDVLAWIDHAPQLRAGLPDTEEVADVLAEARRMAPLRRLVGEHFEGRKDVLERMQAYLEAPDGQNVLFLHGPGGIGKSTVLAKFALDAADRDDVDAIVYLNLDRPILRPEEPLSLLLDLISQLSRQFPDASGPLDKASTTASDFEKRLSYSRKDQSLLETVSSVDSDWDWIVNDVAQAIATLPGERSILVLVDTFEQAQRHGSQVVSEMWRMTNLLMHHAPRLRIIAAGRLEERQFTDNRVPLEAFERSDVARMLNRVSKTQLAPELIDEIYELTDGHPLTVQLAASFVGRVGAEAFDTPQMRQQELSSLKEQKRDALLYGRILQQVSDPQLKQIVVPSLIMRRITPDVIREVLAEPCGLVLEPGQEQDLFDRIAAEIDLVALDYSDPDTPAIVHRPDVRALMLSDLRQDPETPASEIDERAVQYFSGQPGEHARAEEIYHRIWRGDYGFQLENRWIPGVAALLVSALDDLPPDRQTWLSDKLGVAPSQQATETLDLSDWEKSVAAQARRMLTRGDADGVLALLSERADRTPGGELLAIKAEAYLALGDEAAGLEALEQGVQAAQQVDENDHLAEILLLLSQTREGQRQFSQASRDAAQALEIANRLDNQEYQLRAGAALLRLGRKSRSIAGPTRDALEHGLHEIIDTRSDQKSARSLPEIFYTNPGLTRELAAEIGEDHPELLDLSVQQTGSVSTSRNDEVGGKFTQEILRLLAGLGQGSFGKVAEKLLDDEDNNVIQNLPELIALARDRRVLDDVKKPLSMLLSAEVDRQVGAFPSKSMIKRTTGITL